VSGFINYWKGREGKRGDKKRTKKRTSIAHYREYFCLEPLVHRWVLGGELLAFRDEDGIARCTHYAQSLERAVRFKNLTQFTNNEEDVQNLTKRYDTHFKVQILLLY